MIEFSILTRTDKELNDAEIAETLERLIKTLEENNYEAVSVGYNKDYYE